MGFEFSEKEKEDLLYRPLPPHFGYCFNEEEEKEEPKRDILRMTYKEFVDMYVKEHEEDTKIDEDMFVKLQQLLNKPQKRGEVLFG